MVKKALECGLKPIVVINKVDRPDSRPGEVLSEMFDLFVELGAEESPSIFRTSTPAGGRDTPPTIRRSRSGTIAPLLDLVLQKIPGPDVEPDAPLQLMVTSLEWSEYVGRVAIGRIQSGTIRKNQKVVLIREDGRHEPGEIAAIELFDKLGRNEVPSADAGDIVALVGLPDPEIGDTVACPEKPAALKRISVDEPTLSMVFTINNSPLAGQDGKYVTSRHLRTRLFRELESNVALQVDETGRQGFVHGFGRGILHLSILIETMRRESYELSVGKPQVIRKKIDGEWHEPFEILVVDVPAADVGRVMEQVGVRRGQILEMVTNEAGMAHLEFSIPARGLIGLRTRLLNATRGQAVIHHRYESYKPMQGDVPRRANGVLISQEAGKVVAFAMGKLQERAEMFVSPGDDVYEGMIVGENAREGDMVVNPVREKKLTNMRASGSDENILLKPPRELTLEVALEYIEDDEYVEVTPKIVRLRKIGLTEADRKRKFRGK